MKARNLLWISMINIFLLLLVSVMLEYANLSDRFKVLENTVNTALETAVRTSTASEEMFSEKYKSETSSRGTSDSTVASPSTLKVLSKTGNSWVTGKTYVMAHFYEENGRFPDTQSEYNSEESSFSTDADVYKWLFGGIGSVHHDTSLEWATKYKTKLWVNDQAKLDFISKLDAITSSSTSDREPTSDFEEFYNNIGNKMKTTTSLKVKDDDSFKVEAKEIPVLSQMGLLLDSCNEKGSDVTSDNLTSVTHFGKASNGIADTTYYLTPYSLGVTYVPTKVLKPAFLSHLEQIVRYNKYKGDASDESARDFTESTGCIGTDVYVDGGVNSEEHYDASSDNIINDGNIEYDLDDVKVKVDYFYVDFYDDANYNIVNRIEGSTSQYVGDTLMHGLNPINTLPSRLKAKDTSASKDGHRLVAKVSVKIKIHVPYKASILQWFRYLNTTAGDTNHYDIRLFDESTDGIIFDSDGVWFGCSTYTAVHR